MKKLALTIAIVLGLGMTTFAENGCGLFQRGSAEPSGSSGVRNKNLFVSPILPYHGMEDNQPAPLGSGIAVLASLSAAYLVGKKRREED